MVSIRDLISKISVSSDSQQANDFCQLLALWIEDNDDVLLLKENVSNYFAGCDPVSEMASLEAAWSNFSAKAIDHIHGMTMNERLYVFGLNDRFDALKGSEGATKVIYAKLLAD